MGIPKFYRWTSERYPCLSERIKEYQIPEFDNLYLDMNGIIHNCSHPNDEDVHLRIPEEQIFKDIFHYIDFLFKMIKPCKVFFMAIDGVAPRAKMNQQRGRRFRSARLAEDQEAEAIKKGELLPSEERFDSNCITPGTAFMARLHEQLKYFVQVKVSTDPLWQKSGLVIYLSGHDVPGEGEHKIMDFIRHVRSKPDYEPIRHCLYGLDADLVMLGLSTHELQFSLLREEVKFSRPKKPKKGGPKPQAPKQTNGTASYDLTNVSIFTHDKASDLPISIMKPPNSLQDLNKAALVNGKTFASALETPAISAPVVINTPSIDEKKENEQTSEEIFVPLPPDESGVKGVYRAPLPEKTTFLLLHLSLMRDYIDFEFQELKERLEEHPLIEYDLEKVIDDWIFMNILVGNDFVPHLPHFHIVKGALPMLYRIYSDVLPTLDGYINENGVLNLKRFEVFIKRLSKFDIEIFRETYDDMKYMESKTGKNIVLGEKMFEDFDFDKEDTFADDEEALEPMSPELQALAKRTEEEVFGSQKAGTGKLCTDVFINDDDYFDEDDSPELRLEFLQHKRNYYISKLEFEEISTEFLEDFCKEYIRAIQWVLLYYYKGVSSWGWFYPYHYAPFCSDLKNFANYTIQFDIGQPFRPFEQLLAVLPAQSKKLLPGCYQWLMTETNSPIVEFYPQKFEQDLNGKKQDWEAVVLIPFIDETKLLKVMEEEEIKLSKEEAHRNAKGAMMLYSYTKEETGPIKSPMDLFPVLEKSHVAVEKMFEVTYDAATLPKGIHPKAKRNTIYQGFPTLKSKNIEAVIEKAEIKVFEFVTREESMILSLEGLSDDEGVDNVVALAQKLIGRSVWVNWPHLTYAYVTGILTRKAKYSESYGGIKKDPQLTESRVEKEFDSVAKGLIQRHLKFKGMKLGNLNVIIYAKMMEGRKVRCDSKGEVSFETQWSKLEQPFALKTCIYEENVTEIFYLDRNLAKSYLELYNKDDQVIYLGDKLFGAVGNVVGHDEEKSSVIVKLDVPTFDISGESNLKGLVGHNTLKSHDYFTSYNAAGKCQISSYVLSRITGTVFISVEKETKAHKKHLARKAVLKRDSKNLLDSPPDDSSSDDDFPALEMKKINVGLDLKFNKKNLEVRGYTSKRDGVWFYSAKAIKLVNDFVMQFSDFVKFLGRSEKGKDVFEASEIFPQDPLTRVNEMVEWLDERGVRELSRIPTNTTLLDDDDIDSVWKYILKKKSPSNTINQKVWTVRPNLLLKPGLNRGCVPAIPNSTYELLDRVICVDRGAPIPVGHRGTIVGLQTPQASEPEQIEESFKSTGAATLMTLIILSDPTPGVFDKPEDFGIIKPNKSESIDQLSGALASLLGVKDKDVVTETAISNSSAASSLVAVNVEEPKPRLIKLYPYQVINLSQGPALVREGHHTTKQVQGALPVNVLQKQAPKYNNHHEQQQQQPIRILARPPQTVQSRPNGNPFIVYNSKTVQEAKARTQQQATIVNNVQTVKQHQVPQSSKQGASFPQNQHITQAAFVQNNPKPLNNSSGGDVMANQHVNSSSHSVQHGTQNNVVPGRSIIVENSNLGRNQNSNHNPFEIFSQNTAFQQVARNTTQAPPERKGQDILQLLNRANEQYQSRGNRSGGNHSQRHPNPTATHSSRGRVVQNSERNNWRESDSRMPNPPQRWLPQNPPHHHQNHHSAQQHHTGHMHHNHSARPGVPSSFVPLQVDRNRAGGSDSQRHNHHNQASGNMLGQSVARQQPLPTAVISAPVQLLKKPQPEVVPIPVLASGRPDKARQSRLAANFGNFS